jgi:Ser/Thr protein kinase RdoA (MazF antagonist)
MTCHSQLADIGETDIIAFLASNGLRATEVTRYTDGVASQNFRATGPRGLDVTVRRDLRRPLDQVRDDRRYADLASRQGILVPCGPWIDGHIRDMAATARPTISGVSLAELDALELPAPDLIGEMLAALHKAVPPSDNRHFFYAGLLNRSDPLWQRFAQARAAFHQDPDISDLIDQALARFNREASQLHRVTEMPRSLIHGDFNPPNILTSGAKLILIDWEKACTGYPVADVVQAIYYFSALYGSHGLAFAGRFMEAYTRTHAMSRSVLDAWLFCFPAFIFLRDTVSASFQALDPVGRRQLTRFQAYVRSNSAPRFRHFLKNEQVIHCEVLS